MDYLSHNIKKKMDLPHLPPLHRHCPLPPPPSTVISMLSIVIATPLPPVHCAVATVAGIPHTCTTAIDVSRCNAHQCSLLPPPPPLLSIDCIFVYRNSTVHLTPPAICPLSIAPLVGSGGERGWLSQQRLECPADNRWQ